MEMDFDKLIAQREEDNSAKVTEGTNRHRQAVRKTGQLIEITNADGTVTSKASFMGKEEDHSFYYTPDEEVKIAGDYHNVRIFMTDMIQQRGSVFDTNKEPKFVQKWTDTKMNGVLRIMMVQDVGVPIAVVRLVGEDPCGRIHNDPIFEYELPTNFHYSDNLASTFSAIQIMKGQFIGLLFKNERDKKTFNWNLSNLARILSLTKDKIKEVRKQAAQLMDRALNIQLED